MEVVQALPAAIDKVKNAPRKNKTWVAVREMARIAAQVKLGPIWTGLEAANRLLRGIVRKRRNR